MYEGPAAAPENAEGGSRVGGKAHHGGELTGGAEEGQEDGAQSRPAILPHAGDGGRRDRPAGGVADDPQRREGKAMGGGEAGGDMGFHVDGKGTRRRGQRLLVGLRHDREIDAGEVAQAGVGQAAGEAVSPSRIGRPALYAGDDRAGEDRRAGRQGRIEAAGDAEAEDAGRAVGDGGFDERGKPRPAGRDGAQARASRNRRLAGETGNGKDESRQGHA